MASSGQYARIHEAFAQDPILRKRVFDAIEDSPKTAGLFEDIAKYHEAHRGHSTTNGITNGPDEPLTKKRRIDDGALPILQRAHGPPVFEARELSFSIPQRKKLSLCVLGDALSGYTIQVKNAASNEVEAYAFVEMITHILRLPIPEKATKQYNFCVLRKDGEPFLWTVNNGPLKSFTINDPEMQKAVQNEDTVLEDVLDFVMKRHEVKVTYPDDAEFASATPESHRKTETAYHVKAFKGSKDGFLFLVKNGIFFGFKKPLHFFTFDEIESISYTSVLQRTFNLNVSYKPVPDGEPQEIEFSMLDQGDFAGIDAYIKRHELQDASMADARRAKKLNVNKVKVEEVENGDDRTELQKAEAEIEDEEDEEEEDYDPGSEGESEGSGSDDEEEGEEYGDREVDGDVEEELGSEIEEAEVDPDDEDQL